jgi:membrane protease YdiL (CAAX protease family)
MRDYLRSLSRAAEFVIVIGGAFGVFIITSILQAVVQPTIDISDSGLGWLLGYELVLLTLLGSFLYLRGWTPSELGLDPYRSDLLFGVALALAVDAFYLVGAIVASLVFPLQEPVATGSASVTVLNVMTMSVVNPLFEEVFVCGYVVAALQKTRGRWTAINVSTAIRLLYHLYQGAFGVLSIVPTGLIFAYWFARTGRLWAPIVAHGALNFVVLLIGIS